MNNDRMMFILLCLNVFLDIVGLTGIIAFIVIMELSR